MIPGLRWKRAVQRIGRHTINRAAVALLVRGLPAPPYTPRTALVVETIGRRSGRRRRTPVGCLPEGDRLLVVAEHGLTADWVRNALSGPVWVWHRGRRAEARVRVLEDADPLGVLRRMGNPLHAATIRLLAHAPRVVEVRLPGTGPGDEKAARGSC